MGAIEESGSTSPRYEGHENENDIEEENDDEDQNENEDENKDENYEKEDEKEHEGKIDSGEDSCKVQKYPSSLAVYERSIDGLDSNVADAEAKDDAFTNVADSEDHRLPPYLNIKSLSPCQTIGA